MGSGRLRLRALLLPSPADVLFVAALFAPIAVHVPDTDTWWHLAAGRWMIENGQVMVKDVFSFTREGHHWFSHEWLPEVILAGVAGRFGLDALLFVKAVVSLGTVALLWSAVGRHLARWPLARTGVAVLAFGGMVPVMTPRPWMFSLLLFALLVRLWDPPGAGPRRALGIGLLLAAWVNLHGMYALGYIWLGLQSAGGVLDGLLGRAAPEPRDRWPRWAAAGAAMGLGALGALVHPLGLSILAYPFLYAGGTMNMDNQEWLPPDPSSAYGRYLLVLATILVAVLVRAGAPLASWLTVAGLGALAFTSQRHVPLLAIGGAVPLAEALGRLLAAREGASPGSAERGIPSALAAFAWRRFDNFNHVAAGARSRYHVVLLLLLVPLTLGRGRTADLLFRTPVCDRMYPVAASAWLVARGDAPSRRVFNFYGWGGYLIHERAMRPFVDGRTDLYHPEVLADYRRVAGLQRGWSDVLVRQRIDVVLFPAGHALCQVLATEGSYRLVYQDAVAAIYERAAVGG